MRTSVAVHVDRFHCREFEACTTIGSAGNRRSGKLQRERVDLRNALGKHCKPHVCCRPDISLKLPLENNRCSFLSPSQFCIDSHLEGQEEKDFGNYGFRSLPFGADGGVEKKVVTLRL